MPSTGWSGGMLVAGAGWTAARCCRGSSGSSGRPGASKFAPSEVAPLPATVAFPESRGGPVAAAAAATAPGAGPVMAAGGGA